MHLKTFHAPSIQDAIRQARLELGSDAMLLNSRRVSQPGDPASVFAVTFALAAQTRAAPSSGNNATPAECDVAKPEVAARKGGHGNRTGRPSADQDSRRGSPYREEKLMLDPVLPKPSTQARQTVSEPPVVATPPSPTVKASEPDRSDRAVRSSFTNSAPARLMPLDVNPQANDASNSHEATPADTAKPAASPAAYSAVPYPVVLPSYEKLFEQMTSMRREMLQLAGSVRRASASTYRQDLPSEELRWIYDVLLSQEFYPELIEEVVEQLMPRLTSVTGAGREAKSNKGRRTRKEEPNPAHGLLPLLRETLSASIELMPEPSLRRRSSAPHLVALVGPPGVGKTTTLVKLAARYGVYSRFPLQVISMDNYRVAASEQLRTYASVLGIGFDALCSASALEKALRQYQSKELILIDTPGYGWRDFSAAEDLAAVLSQGESATIHLVVSASMKPADLVRVADLYEVFSYHSILFTKIDETATIGPLVSESSLRRKPLSYLCDGQRIPEDIEVATRERILERVLPSALSSEECAA
ncbi:MAG: hypothetical protein KIT83_03100 [Bryobacterales bacterium]|nr:hypothetical protein [Bryobacterales bacterium]